MMNYILIKIESGHMSIEGFSDNNNAIKKMKTDFETNKKDNGTTKAEYTEINISATEKEIFAKTTDKNNNTTIWQVCKVNRLSMLLPAAENNKFDVSYGSDPAFPGIDVEYIAENETNESDLTRPRVLVEQECEQPNELSVRVWSDPGTEDYTQKITLEKDYYK